jgi:hypothetical protein
MRRGGGEEHEAVVEVLAVAVERELGVVGEAEVEIEPARLEGTEEGRMRGPHRQVVQQPAAPGALVLPGRGDGDDEEEEERGQVARRRHGCADLAAQGVLIRGGGLVWRSSDGDDESRRFVIACDRKCFSAPMTPVSVLSLYFESSLL